MFDTFFSAPPYWVFDEWSDYVAKFPPSNFLWTTDKWKAGENRILSIGHTGGCHMCSSLTRELLWSWNTFLNLGVFKRLFNCSWTRCSAYRRSCVVQWHREHIHIVVPGGEVNKLWITHSSLSTSEAVKMLWGQSLCNQRHRITLGEYRLRTVTVAHIAGFLFLRLC